MKQVRAIIIMIVVLVLVDANIGYFKYEGSARSGINK